MKTYTFEVRGTVRIQANSLDDAQEQAKTVSLDDKDLELVPVPTHQ